MKNSALAKYHSWIVFAAALVLLFGAFLAMFFMATGTIKARSEEINKQVADLGLKVESRGAIDLLKQQQTTMDAKRGELWFDNYERQTSAKIFAWPASRDANLKVLGARDLKFGEDIVVNNNELNPSVILKSFETGYEQLSTQTAPTRFGSGGTPTWRSVFRHVADWGNKISVEVPWLWLALEDYWVQRAVLLPIRDFNVEASIFKDVTPKPSKAGDDNPLKRTFRNRVWELKLEVTDPLGKPAIAGTLRNTTSRLQLLGVEKLMRLKVWFKDKVDEEPDAILELRGELVPGGGELEIKSQKLANVGDIAKITRVQQVFDEATVPVRLVTNIELGLLDNKNKAAVLEMPEHIAKIVPETPTGSGGDVSGGGFQGSSAGGPPGGIPGGGKGDDEDLAGRYGGSGGGGAGGAATKGKSGNWKSVLEGNKARYVKRTSDVRRMPFGLSVVVDADCVNDLLVAYANSPLRIQITQTQWQRFRDTLPPIPSEGGAGSPIAALPPRGGSTFPGSGGGRGGLGDDDPDAPGAGGGYPGSGGRLPGSGGGFPGGPTVPVPTSPSATPGFKSLPAEASAGLSELAIFGVLSLYEKPEKKPESKPEEPKPEEPKTEQPAPGEGDPKPSQPKPNVPAPTSPAPPTAPKPTEPKPNVPAPTSPVPPSTAPKPTGGEPKTPDDSKK